MTIPMNEYRRMPKRDGGWRSERWEEFNRHCEILAGCTPFDDEIADYGGFLLDMIAHYEAIMDRHGIVPLDMAAVAPAAEKEGG